LSFTPACRNIVSSCVVSAAAIGFALLAKAYLEPPLPHCAGIRFNS
jgi:hypothetical protein